MLAYSPYDNLPPAGARPDLLVTGAVHDPRVMVREPAKWVAALRESDPEWSPRCLFRCETGRRRARRPVRAASATSATRPRSTPGSWTGWGSPHELTSLHDEVIRVARDLIRLDTTQRPGARASGNETLCAEYLQRLPERVRRRVRAGRPRRRTGRTWWRGSPGSRLDRRSAAESLAFVGHTDVVPCDPRDWTHPPFEAVVDDDGWLWGRGAVDMKNEVAARAVAMAELARSGFRPRGDLWLLAVADEEDGFADVGMRWLLEERPDIRPTHSVNEGGGERLPLSDGREVVGRVASARRAPSRSRSSAVGRGRARVHAHAGRATPYPLLARAAAPPRRRACPSRAPRPRRSRCCARCSAATSRTCSRRARGGRRAARRARRLDPGADGLDDGADACCGARTSAT